MYLALILKPNMIKFEKKDWAGYNKVAKAYLARPNFKGTPITAEHLSQSAKETYEATGVFLPVELALSQGQFEGHMGTKGRSPATNPFNVGEYDDGTKMTFKDTKAGVKAYYDLMASDYLKTNSVEGLMKNFVNKNGDRYASNPDYESDISGQMSHIRKNYMR